VVEIHAPLGVVAAITPWNFPLGLLMHKVAPALLAGNTMVAKPAGTTPLTSLLFGTLCAQILPRGVINIVADANDLGGYLTAHSGIAKIAFTGSTATGRQVMANAAPAIKRITLELGGNDAALVLDDADVKSVAGKVFQGAMFNAGQVCIAVKRAYVPEAMYDEFVSELCGLADAAIVDDGLKQGTQIGPIQNKAQFDRLASLLEDSRAEGTIAAGGVLPDRPGYFIQPTIVRDIGDDARLVREEQFGPILPVLRYNDLDEAIGRVNDTSFGLGGSVWGSDVARAQDVAARIESGTVWVNQTLVLDNAVPFRGAKQSGVGASLGVAGLKEYTQARIISTAPSVAA
jgi:acyl-CoA reductase-like NAD-dependent aldehyde dehydrogenase